MTATKSADGARGRRDDVVELTPVLRLVVSRDTPLSPACRQDGAREAREQARTISNYLATDPQGIIWMLRALA